MNDLKAQLRSMKQTFYQQKPSSPYNSFDQIFAPSPPPSLLPKVSQPLPTAKEAYKSVFGDRDFFLRHKQQIEQEKAAKRAAKRLQRSQKSAPSSSSKSPNLPPKDQLSINPLSQYLHNLVVTEPTELKNDTPSQSDTSSQTDVSVLPVFAQQQESHAETHAESSTTQQQT